MGAERKLARERAQMLFADSQKKELFSAPPEKLLKQESIPTAGVSLLLYHAGLKLPAGLLIALSILCGLLSGIMSAKFLSPYFIPIFFAAGAYIPFSYVENCARKRALEFAGDYPTVLLAAASSIKAGLTAYLALERSVRLLPRMSLARLEVEKLLSALRQGCPKEEAIRKFGQEVRLPELNLFRSAFLLVMENGGKFAPTLERLSKVSKDRQMLIGSARVSTATMRMTANIVLGVAPFLLFVISLRSKDFWQTLFHHPTANFVASIGIVLIAGSYAVLRRMSEFRP